MKRTLLPIVIIAGLTAVGMAATASPVFQGTANYTDTQAGYAIDYPAQAGLTSGLDAALGFNTVFIHFPSDSGDFVGAIIAVFDNPERTPIDAFARERFGLSRVAAGAVRGEWIGGMPALLAGRPSPLAGEDAAVALVEGDGVIIRIGLFGGGVDGPIEPPTLHFDWFNQIVHSIRRVPRQAPPAPVPAVTPGAQAVTATVFQRPFNVDVMTFYAEQYGVAVSNTAYGVRNLGLEHRRTCFGVDWPRLLHSGVDWFRADGQYTPTDVVAVADGVVAWYDPSYNTYPGKVVIVRHRLTDGRDVYSVYAHLGPDVSIVQEQVVARGQRIGSTLNQGSNTHLHFELRYFLDGRFIYGPYTACNSSILYVGRGYTYRIYPDDFPTPDAGYVDPIAFIDAHGSQTADTSTSEQADPPVQLVSSTLKAVSLEPTLVVRPDASPTMINALIMPPALEPASPITFTEPFTPTVFIYLPVLSREVPRQEPACVEGQPLLLNSGLEGGSASAPWVQSRNGASDLIQDRRPYTGTYGLWFGGRDIADEEVLQSFILPYYTEGITLTFQRYLTTTEVEQQPFDKLEVVIENASGYEVTPRLALDNTSAPYEAWTPETVVLSGLQGLGGRRLQLSLKVATDSMLTTSFFVDEVALATRCGQ